MTVLRLDAAPTATNDIGQPAPNSNEAPNWLPSFGLFGAIITRMGPAIPGTADLKVIADPTDSNQDPGKRFYPFLNIRVVIVTPAGFADVPIFIGRIDTASIIDDTGNGQPRYWHILARDWLSVLADNNVGSGTWRSASDPNITRNVAIPSNFQWDGNYNDDYLKRDLKWDSSVIEAGQTLQHTQVPLYGEFRQFIVADLCLNRIPDKGQSGLPLGIRSIILSVPPNSKPINWSISQIGAIPILDAITSLITADPWFLCNAHQGCPTYVDTQDIEQLNFPELAGIGGELQIAAYNAAGNFDGRLVEYYARGYRTSNAVAAFQNSANGLSITHYIVSHTFAKQGSDIFSRITSYGKGDSSEFTVNLDYGTGVVFNPMENSWDPINGNFNVRRETTSREQTTVGYAGYQQTYPVTKQDETKLVKARGLHDQSYADLMSGAAALESQRGGINQGTVTVAGPPVVIDPFFGVPTIILRPGYTIEVILPQAGIVEAAGNTTFVMDGVQYSWPDETTTFTLSRISHTDIRRQLTYLTDSANQANAAAMNQIVSPWQVIDPSGKMQWLHNVGTFGSKVQVEAAWWDGTTVDQNNNIAPEPNTVVPVQNASWDSGQAQNIGCYIAQNDNGTLTVYFNYWVANSDGKGMWLSSLSPNTVVRTKITP